MIDELQFWCPKFSQKASQMEAAYWDIHMAKHSADETEAIFRFENALFWLAFFSRRLFDEAHMFKSISKQTAQIALVRSILSISERKIDLRESIGENFSADTSFSVNFARVCNELIHSKMLNWEWTPPSGRNGFYCSSDRNAATRILFVPNTVVQDAANSIAQIFPYEASK